MKMLVCSFGCLMKRKLYNVCWYGCVSVWPALHIFLHTLV